MYTPCIMETTVNRLMQTKQEQRLLDQSIVRLIDRRLWWYSEHAGAIIKIKDNRFVPAGTKDDLVRPEAGLSADQGHVDEYLRV